MGRIGISYLEVAKTAAELQGEGINPTVDAVREKLQTGSRSTIGPYLKQWRNKQEENNGNTGSLPPELYALTKELFNKLQGTADAKIEIAEKAAQAEIDSIQEKLNLSNAQNISLEKEIQSINSKIFELTAQNTQQKSDLENEQKQNLGLTAKNQELEARLHDKILQIQLLEKQLNNVQANLEHYRESMNIQRENDKRAWERELTLLNQEIKELRDQILEGNKANQILDQKFEAIQVEKSQLQKDWHEQKGKTMELQEQLKIKEYIIKNLEERYNEYTITNQKLEEQKNQIQTTFKQLEKENLILKERLTLNEKMLKRSEDMNANLHNDRLFLTQEVSKLKLDAKILEKSLS